MIYLFYYTLMCFSISILYILNLWKAVVRIPMDKSERSSEEIRHTYAISPLIWNINIRNGISRVFYRYSAFQLSIKCIDCDKKQKTQFFNVVFFKSNYYLTKKMLNLKHDYIGNFFTKHDFSSNPHTITYMLQPIFKVLLKGERRYFNSYFIFRIIAISFLGYVVMFLFVQYTTSDAGILENTKCFK